jgi:CubicO group peptidase (beta-lactamase class C family)
MTGVPANLDMHLRIGGVSESFFGTLVMILVDQGKIRLDDKISKWLPDLLAADKVTIEMLIKNASGYQIMKRIKILLTLL